MQAIQDNPDLLKDSDVARLVMGDKTFMKDLLAKATNYGFDVSDKSAGEINTGSGSKAVNIFADKVVMEKAINGNGNGKH